MKKHLVMLSAALCLAGFQAWGQVNAVLTISSDYMWRGVSFNSYSGAAVQGDLSYGLGHGLTLGAWASNITADAYANTYGGYEFDPYLLYTHEMDGMSVYAMAQWINYIRSSKNNAMEYTLGINWKGVNASVIHQPNMYGWDIAYTYFQINYGHNLTENLWLVGTYGHHDVEEYTAFFGRKDFSHAKLALQVRKDKNTFEMAFSKTFGAEDNSNPANKWKDEATIITYIMNM